MSKKYFAKYFPIEGEINENNNTIINNETGRVYLLYAPKSITSIALEQGDKVAKLFLCSRDTPENWNNPHVDYWDGIKEEDRYRVIGEISPDATWVKEGDEFDEEEIVVSRKPMKKYIENNPYCKIVNIKGPCGHFH